MDILRKITRILLIVSLVSLVFSSLFLAIYGEINELTFNNFTSIFIWYSLMYTMWIIFLSIPILIIISLWRKVNNDVVWTYIKKEAILSLIATAFTSLIILFCYKPY
ncbi:hypothetical protein D3C87_594690 [compost metagenome]